MCNYRKAIKSGWLSRNTSFCSAVLSLLHGSILTKNYPLYYVWILRHIHKIFSIVVQLHACIYTQSHALIEFASHWMHTTLLDNLYRTYFVWYQMWTETNWIKHWLVRMYFLDACHFILSYTYTTHLIRFYKCKMFNECGFLYV